MKLSLASSRMGLSDYRRNPPLTLVPSHHYPGFQFLRDLSIRR